MAVELLNYPVQKSCPFCGKDAYFFTDGNECWVECSKCKARSRKVSDAGGAHRDEALEWWDKRTKPKKPKFKWRNAFKGFFEKV